VGIRAQPLRGRARSGAFAIAGNAPDGLPEWPYCGIRPFGYADHKIFFARADETRDLSRLVAIHRGVLLYGDSGAGKSSLVNAGLLPTLIEDGMACERLRLQPRVDEEIVLERIEGTGADALLDPLFAGGDESASPRVLSVESFERQVRAACAHRELLLVFDHFENIVVLFDGAELEHARRRVIEMLVGLLRDETLKVKVMMVFREDYLGSIRELLSGCPERLVKLVRLKAPGAEALERIVRGPFERYPGHYEPEFAPSLMQRLLGLLDERFSAGKVSLPEVQVVCLRVWQSEQPQRLLDARGLQGILEDYLSEELDEMAPRMRDAAIVLLSEMVTSAGTRNVSSGEDLARRVSEHDGISRELVWETLERLDQRSRLVHCERRRELRLYEIASEFLVPWISERREHLERQRERRREQRRRRLLWRMATAAVLVSAILAGLTIWALVQRDTARRAQTASRREAVAATSLALLSASQQQPSERPEASLLLALDAYEMNAGGQARNILVSALEELGSDGVLGILHTANASVSSLAFSPSGQVLVAGTGDGTARLWNVSTRKQIATISAGSEAVVRVIFAPNGGMFATADEDGTIKLWDARTYRQIGSPIETHDRALNDVAFAPNGTVLAAGGLDGPLSLWSVATHEELGQPIATTDVESLTFSPDGQTLATGDNKRFVRLWSVKTRRELGAPLVTFTDEVTEVAFGPDGRTLATLTTELFGSGRIQLWNIASHRQLGTAIGANKEINGFAFADSGRTLVLGGNGGTTLWSVASHTEVGQPLRGASKVTSVAVSPDGGMIASSEGDLVELASVVPARSLESLGGARARLLGFAGEGRTLVSVSARGQVRHWDPVTHRQVGRMLDTSPVAARCRVLSADGSTLASEGRSGTIWVWDLVTGRLLATVTTGPAFEGEPSEAEYAGCAQRLSLSPYGRLLAVIAGEAGEEIQLWNVASRRPVGRLLDGESFDKVLFSPDGGTLVSVSPESTSRQAHSRIQLWDVKSRRRLARAIAVGGEVGQVASGPHGRPVALVHIPKEAAEVGGVLIWEAAARKQLGQLPLAQSELVAAVTLSPNGQTLATVSGEAGGDEEAGGRVRLWAPATRESVGMPLLEGPEAVSSVVFNPTGTSLALLVEEGAIRLWRGILWTNPHELHTRVCRLVGEGLTQAEWNSAVPGIPYNPVC
jgi:WD40 repeat protein